MDETKRNETISVSPIVFSSEWKVIGVIEATGVVTEPDPNSLIRLLPEIVSVVSQDENGWIEILTDSNTNSKAVVVGSLDVSESGSYLINCQDAEFYTLSNQLTRAGSTWFSSFFPSSFPLLPSPFSHMSRHHDYQKE